MEELPPLPDQRKTVLRAVKIVVMLVIAIIGMCYSGWVIWIGK